MASDLYLCRKNGRFFKYDAVEAVSLTGAIQTFSGVTGNATTNVVTISGATLSDGLQITFTQKTGSNIVANRTYFARDCSGATCKLEEYVGAGVFTLGTTLADGNVTIQSDEMKVWSSEYRDIFTATTPIQTNVEEAIVESFSYTSSAQKIDSPVAALPTGLTNYSESVNISGGTVLGGVGWNLTADAFVASVSDEINHYPLRQTFLARTHWKFDMGSSVAPRYLFAEWQTGDALAPNPPNTI
jgi:hypothetical protein